jgi:hypothetical protein
LGLSAIFYLMGQALLPNLVSYIVPFEAQILLNFAWTIINLLCEFIMGIILNFVKRN